jgi:hypothetical protein
MSLSVDKDYTGKFPPHSDLMNSDSFRAPSGCDAQGLLQPCRQTCSRDSAGSSNYPEETGHENDHRDASRRNICRLPQALIVRLGVASRNTSKVPFGLNQVGLNSKVDPVFFQTTLPVMLKPRQRSFIWLCRERKVPLEKPVEQLRLAWQAGKAVEAASRPEGTARCPIFLELCPLALRLVLRA